MPKKLYLCALLSACGSGGAMNAEDGSVFDGSTEASVPTPDVALESRTTIDAAEETAVGDARPDIDVHDGRTESEDSSVRDAAAADVTADASSACPTLLPGRWVIAWDSGTCAATMGAAYARNELFPVRQNGCEVTVQFLRDRTVTGTLQRDGSWAASADQVEYTATFSQERPGDIEFRSFDGRIRTPNGACGILGWFQFR